MSLDLPPNAAASLPKTSTRRRWIAALAAIVIFVAGMASGAALTVLIAVRHFHDAIQHPEQAPERLAAHLERRLDLDEKQAAKIREIIAARQSELNAIRRRVWPEVMEQLKLLHEEITAELNPEQRRQWRTMIEQFHERWLPPPGE